jgi:L-histidine N-alpha-methyltransferase
MGQAIAHRRRQPPEKVARERAGARPLELKILREDVVAGLSRPQKSLPPKYFYDAAGSRLFARICRLPEYYVTRAELAITRRHLPAIARFAGRGCQLIEYGSGEGIKSRLLIRALRPSVYVPIDISEDALRAAVRGLAREFPWLRVAPLAGDFSRPIDIPVRRGTPSVVYFPGSTIGNLTAEEAHGFLSMSRGVATRMIVGVDLKKDPAVLHAAYNDKAGVTAAFNLNLLARINRELGADFEPRRFRHYAFYNPAAGRIEMHLVALEAHTVRLGRHRFRFAAGETIHTENSYKYSPDEFAALAARAGFGGVKAWSDRRGLFGVFGLTA